MLRTELLLKLTLTGAILILPAMAFGDDDKSPEGSASGTTSTQATLRASHADSKFMGFFELRPSWTTKFGEVHSEDTAEVGYLFDKDTRLTYVQWFNTNFYNPPNGTGASTGLGLFANDGIIRFRKDNLWVSDDKLINFGIQQRLYTPTYAVRRDAGMLTTSRTYFRVQYKVSKTLSVDFSEVPTVFAYTRAGSGNAANPAVENMNVLNADFRLSKDITFSIPVIYELTKYRNFLSTAQYDGRWFSNLWIWPELDYQIDTNNCIGVAFYSDNLMKDNFSGFDLHNGLEKGITQVLWNVSL